MLSGFQVHNQLAPKQLPRALRWLADFSAQTTQEFDLSKEQDQDQLDFVQSVWIDNTLSTRRLDIVVQGIPQQLKVPALSIACLPIIHPGYFKATFSVSAVMAPPIPPVPVIFLNVPMAYLVYLPGAV